MKAEQSLLWMVRASAALGLLALSLTAELTPFYLYAGWLAWLVGFLTDRHPERQERWRPFDNAAVFVMIGAMVIDFWLFRQNVFNAVAHFLILFQTYKLVGRKTAKDNLQILIFSFFHILSACTLSAEIWQAFIFIALIPVAVAGLFWHQVVNEKETHALRVSVSDAQAYRRLAWAMAMIALPVTVVVTLVIFALFPRLNWNVRIPGFGNERVGYSEEVDLTRTGELGTNHALVLWMGFRNSRERERWSGYLRGATFSFFDGRQWRPQRRTRTLHLGTSRSVGLVPPSKGLEPLQTSVTLIDVSAATVFTPGVPIQLQSPLPSIELGSDGSLTFTSSWRKPLTYRILAHADLGKGGPAWPLEDLTPYRVLPDRISPRVRELAARVAGSGSDEQQMQRLLTHFQNDYAYSTSLGDAPVDDPVENFLFNRKRGPCGYFASAMALTLRLQGIPSRVVAGYWRGEWNEIADQVVIRQKDAHAWVEAWLPERGGWVRIDPSPRTPDVGGTGMLGRSRLEMRQLWDYLNLKWNQYVIEYDLYSQVRAFETLRRRSQQLNTWMENWFGKSTPRRISLSRDRAAAPAQIPMTLLLWLAAAILCGITAHLLWRRRHPEDAYRRFLSMMARKGFPKHLNETGLEFAQRLVQSRPKEAASIQQITETYYHRRFAELH